MPISWMPLFQGFSIGAGLIIAIGIQNAFVLSQGIKRQRRLLTATFCALCDTTLILIGVLGLGGFIMQHPSLLQIAKWGGIIFLSGYGLKTFYAAYHTSSSSQLRAKDSTHQGKTTAKTILTVLALSLLNPHAWLDAVVLLGSIATHYTHSGRLFFALGAVLASWTWFFTLVYGASLLSPLFKSPLTWRCLDIVIGLVMLGIAVSLFVTM